MSSPEDALLFLDQDKGRGLGAEERRRLSADPRLRSGWLQYQALQALALEAAPIPGEKMTREVLAQCRREQVSRQLSRITGGDELARELLLEGASHDRGPVWLYALGLTGLLALGWLAWRGLNPAQEGRDATDAAPFVAGAPVPFEFPVQTPPADAALAGPADADNASLSDADDVHDEAPAARQASRLLRDTLQAAQERDREGDDTNADAVSPPAGAAHPSAAKSGAPSASPAQASSSMALSAGAVPLSVSAAAKPTIATLKPGLTLSSDSLLASAPAASNGATSTASVEAGPLDIRVDLPQPRDIDVRLFSPTGQSVRSLASGLFGPGSVHFSLDARDAKGQVLAPGTYYLRVMTPWFSRVEPIQIH